MLAGSSPPAFFVFVRRWDGGTWMEYPGSAQNGGIPQATRPDQYAPQKIIVDSLDRAVVAWHDDRAGGVLPEVYARRFGWRPTDLGQFFGPGGAPIALGQATLQTSVMLQGRISGNLLPRDGRLQIEVVPAGSAFTGRPTAEAATYLPVGELQTVAVSGLAWGVRYQWQARVVDVGGQVSDWVPFGGNPAGQTDFAIQRPKRHENNEHICGVSGAGAGGDILLMGAGLLAAFSVVLLVRKAG